jgi:hypothetical protein
MGGARITSGSGHRKVAFSIAPDAIALQTFLSDAGFLKPHLVELLVVADPRFGVIASAPAGGLRAAA